MRCAVIDACTLCRRKKPRSKVKVEAEVDADVHGAIQHGGGGPRDQANAANAPAQQNGWIM